MSAHSFGPVVAQNSEVLGPNPSWVESLSSGLCITVYLTVQKPGVSSAVYGSVYDKKTLEVI